MTPKSFIPDKPSSLPKSFIPDTQTVNPNAAPVANDIVSSEIRAISSAAKDQGRRASEFVDSIDSNRPFSEQLGKYVSAGVGAGNLLFSPIAGAMNTIDKMPGGKLVTVPLGWLFGGLDKLGRAVGNKAVDVLPVSEQTKQNLREPISEAGGFVSQLAGGELAARGLPVAREALKSSERVAGRALSGTGEVIFNNAITPNAAEAPRIQNYRADTPFLKRVSNTLSGVESPGKPNLRSTTALEKGIFGRQVDVGVKATRQAKELWAKIDPAVKASDAVVTKADLFEPSVDLINKTAEPGRKAALHDAFDAIQTDYKNIDNISLDEAQAIKRGLDEFTPEKMFNGKNVSNEYTTLKHEMADAIRQKTYEALKDQNIKQDYLDYANLMKLREIGVKALTDTGKRGGFGNFWSTVYDAATTPVKTVSGQVLYHVGNKLEFWGKPGIKSFGEYLETQGFGRRVSPLTIFGIGASKANERNSTIPLFSRGNNPN